MKLPLFRIAKALSATARAERKDRLVAQGYSIDSRTIQPGELFFAVKGERLDGHDYVQAALAAGAVGAVVRREQAARYPAQDRLLLVDDTIAALQQLGAAVRGLWRKPLIGVTGSAGKTTTKEAIAQVLRARFRVMKSEGNLNNQFGLPLMLLRLQPEDEIAVVEMGMSHPGEIAALARLAQPDIGVVTCVAPVHLEFFHSVAEIARAKYELIESLADSGTAVLNADDEYVSQFGRDFRGKIFTFGLHRPADVRAERIQPRGPLGAEFDVVAGGERAHARLGLVGEHNIYNALAAVAAGLGCGIHISQAVAALTSLAPADQRGQVLEVAAATVINDCYNSNPRALDSMVDALAGMPAKRHIVVAGEMLELGPAGPEMHRACGRHMAERGLDMLLGVRGAARQMVEAARQAGVRAEFVATPEEAGEWLAREARPGDAVLLKASRGVRLERALETWKARLQVAAGNAH